MKTLRNKFKVLFGLIHGFILNIANRGTIKFSRHLHLKKNAKLSTLDKHSLIDLGDGIKICENSYLEASDGGKIRLAGHNFINRNCMIISKDNITIGRGTTIGPNVCIYDHNHDIYNGPGVFTKKSVYIGKNVWIGAGAIILQGVCIGDNSVVAAGAIVTKDVPPDTIVRTQSIPVYTEIKR